MIPVSAYAGRKVAVFGLGLTGEASARALKQGGADVLAWDDREAARAKAAGEGYTVSSPADWPWDVLAGVLLSPGVPLTHPKPHGVVEMANKHGTPVIGDVELFARAVNAMPEDARPKIIAITGTNGKSTTTALIGHLLRECGADVHVGGNIGEAVLNMPAPKAGAVYVLELSSYQLDLTHSLDANVAVWLNISPDHLDRHGDMAGYIKAKKRIFRNQTPADTCVIGVDDEASQRVCTDVIAANGRRVVPVSSGAALGRGVFVLDGVLFSRLDNKTLEITDLKTAAALPGAHNWQNAAAAFAAAHAITPDAEDLAAALLTFPGLAHRQEIVRRLGKVTFVNDSKATNPDAAAKAVSSYDSVYWIAGGKAKDGGLDTLRPALGGVKKSYFIGEAGEEMARALKTNLSVPGEVVGELRRAVAHAARDALASGEEAVVLLSPACASFDQFKNFEARGDAFREFVGAIGEGAAAPAAKGGAAA